MKCGRGVSGMTFIVNVRSQTICKPDNRLKDLSEQENQTRITKYNSICLNEEDIGFNSYII
jgi:hypothetical protein